MTTRCTARATVTVEVLNLGTYGEEWTIAAIHKDAKQGAIQRIHNATRMTDVRVVGDVKITAVLVHED